VNVLIAIADPSHVFHPAIHRWLAEGADQTWASCPMTENGMARILSQPAYAGGARAPAQAIATLRRMKQASPWKHVFWADDLSVTDEDAIRSERIAAQGWAAGDFRFRSGVAGGSGWKQGTD